MTAQRSIAILGGTGDLDSGLAKIGINRRRYKVPGAGIRITGLS